MASSDLVDCTRYLNDATAVSTLGDDYEDNDRTISEMYYNPCLAYNDDNQMNCAFCKPGTARIFVTTKDTDKYVVCGSVRKPDRVDGAYVYLNPADGAFT